MIRIGATDELPIPKARLLALEILGDLLAGKNRNPPGTPDGPAVLPEAPTAAASSSHTLEGAFEDYFRFATAHRKPSTVVAYRWQWGKYLREWAGTRILSDIRRREVSQLHLTLGERCGQHTANRVLALLRAVINRAIREYELDLPNPAAGIMFYRERSRTRRLTQSELPTFLQAVAEEPSSNVRDFVLLALFTGVRKSNLLAMRWEHLDLDSGI